MGNLQSNNLNIYIYTVTHRL
eukprot:COSAG05_NODE_9500_length_620_cov_0.750480_2_plen_20_part_01